MAGNPRKPDDGEEVFEPTRELGAPVPMPTQRSGGAEEAGAATALMDLDSMEGLQAKSRPGSSMPPPPNSDAQPTSVFEPKQLDELVDKVSSEPSPKLQRAPSTALVQSARSRFTPTLRSADFEAAQAPSRWPLLVGIALFGAGVGAFVGLRPKEPSPAVETKAVELAVRATPASAMFRLDGEALAGNPHRSERPRGKLRQTLTIEAPGYAPQSVDVILDSSTTVDVALTAAAPVAPKP